MNKLKKWFKREILPYIILAGFVIGVIALLAGLFWLDKVRFIF